MWSIVLWEDVSQSSLVFGVGLSVLLSMRMIQWDKVPVAAILCQGLLTLLIFNTIKRIFTPVKHRSKGGKYKLISEEALQRLVTRSVTVVNTLAPLLSGEDTVGSEEFAWGNGLLTILNTYPWHLQELTTKAGAALFAMAHLTSVFSFATILSLSFIGAFTAPTLYYVHRSKVDMVWHPLIE